MSLGQILLGGVGAIFSPAGFVLFLPVLAFALALTGPVDRSFRERVVGPGLLVVAFTMTAVMARPSLFASLAPPFSTLFGRGLFQDAAVLGVLWLGIGVVSFRGAWSSRWMGWGAFALGGVLLVRLIPPVQGPVLAVLTGPLAATSRVVPLGWYYLGLALGLGLLALLTLEASRKVAPTFARRLGGVGLVVLGLCLLTGVYGRLVEQVILRWPPNGLG